MDGRHVYVDVMESTKGPVLDHDRLHLDVTGIKIRDQPNTA